MDYLSKNTFLACAQQKPPIGTNWSKISSTISTDTWYSIIGYVPEISKFIGTIGGGNTNIYFSDDGTTWDSTVQGPTNNILYDITLFGNTWVVSSGGSVYYSQNNMESWNFASGRGYAFAKSTTTLVVVDSLNLEIASSTNGTDWTVRYSGPDQFNDIARSGSIFVAVGEGGAIRTSPDGITWTSRASGVTDPLIAVEWTGSIFVAVSYASSTILTSTNGTTWTQQVISESGFYGFESIASINSLIVLDGTLMSNDSGTSWTPINNRITSGLVFSSGSFILFSNAHVYTSTVDGISWDIKKINATLNGTTKYLPFMGKYLVASSLPNTILTTEDFQVWQYINIGMGQVTSTATTSVTSSSTAVVVGTSNNGAYYSTNGSAWTRVSTATQVNRVTWTGAKFLLVDMAGYLRVSSNGTTWSNYMSASVPVYAAILIGTRYTVVCANGIIKTTTNPDGWPTAASGTTQTLRCIAYYNGIYVVGGDNGTILTSANATSWTAVTSTVFGTAYDIKDIIVQAGKFIIVGESGKMASSSDGVTWVEISTPTNDTINAVILDTNRLIAVGAKNTVLFSE